VLLAGLADVHLAWLEATGEELARPAVVRMAVADQLA
jgi:hypothetical protein